MANCSSCGGKKNKTVSTPAQYQSMVAERERILMNDNDYVLVLYTHPNRGKHGVIGMGTKKNYGYRSGGDQFLVHKNDVAAQPQYFRVIQSAEQVKISQPTPSTPPPPQPISKPPEQKKVTIPPSMVDELYDKESLDRISEMVVQSSKPKNMVDLGALPGVTPAIEKNLRDAGIVTIEDFQEKGVDGLVKVKYVGEARAEAIMAYIASLEVTEDDSD